MQVADSISNHRCLTLGHHESLDSRHVAAALRAKGFTASQAKATAATLFDGLEEAILASRI
jgi:hypothetical protein